jgi:DNA-directed RNA polymerase sigma subunit (sigma70/sigma32)
MLPSSLCLVDIECIDIPREDEEEVDVIEELFETVRPFLTRREERMLSLKLGLTYEGALTNLEIAGLLGCCESNVRDALKKALRRIDDLVTRGRIRPRRNS